MLKNRIIPCLLLSNDGLVKTQKFKNPAYVGDPINAIRIFNEKEVDELLLIDIDATRNNTGPNYDLIEQVASECFMPLCYGGGVRSIDDVKTLFSLGVEKICLQSAAFDNLRLITEIVQQYGSQSVVISADVKTSGIFKKKSLLYSFLKNKSLPLDWREHLKNVQKSGAGEILLTAVHRDGMRTGMDLSLIKEASELLDIPLIACGGVGKIEDITDAIKAGANAVAAGAFFVWHGPHKAVLISYPFCNNGLIA